MLNLMLFVYVFSPPVWPQYGQKLESSNSASELDLQDRRETQHFKIPRCRARGCRWFVLFGRDVCWLPKGTKLERAVHGLHGYTWWLIPLSKLVSSPQL